VEENRANYCKALSGKTLYSALYGTYTVTLNELKGLLKASIFSEEKGNSKSTGEPHQEEGFQEVRRRKRQNTDETSKTVKKTAVKAKTPPLLNSCPTKVATRNFFAPLRTSMDTDSAGAEASTHEDSPWQSR
jgi:hypothetical protein